MEKQPDQATVLKGGLTELEYYTTPPVMPVDFSVNDLTYRGDFQWDLPKVSWDKKTLSNAPTNGF